MQLAGVCVQVGIFTWHNCFQSPQMDDFLEKLPFSKNKPCSEAQSFLYEAVDVFIKSLLLVNY